MNDLKLALGMIREVGIPFGVVVNRAGMGDGRVKEFCEKENIDLIARIPESREMAERYSGGEFAYFFIQEFQDKLDSIISGTGIKRDLKGILR